MTHLSLASGLLAFLFAAAPLAAATVQPVADARSIDGAGNNGSHAQWGAAGSSLIRIAQTTTSSGAYYPNDGSGTTFLGGPSSGAAAPNPRDISNGLFDSQGKSTPSRRHLSNMLWQWGQFLDHDITLVETSASLSEFAPIDVSPGDPLSPLIPFQRSDYLPATGTNAANPRQQYNSITSYIDASNVYGSDTARAGALREFSGGRLQTSAGNLLPLNSMGLPNAGGTSSTLFLGGDIRANEQVGLTAMHTLFMREHNRLAGLLEAQNPSWSDEDLFQTTRKIVGAEIQAVTYGEFLPTLLGKRNARRLRADDYSYDDTLDAAISNEFSAATFRFGHSMLPESLPLARVGQSPAGSLPLKNAFFDPSFLASDATGATNRLDQILLGLSRSVAQEIDVQVTDAVRNFLFGPPGAGGMDLVALNIQRGRDHGLPSYNDMRTAYGLSPALSFSDITNDHPLQHQLEQIYASVDQVDAWVGALAEDHVRGGSVGELTLASIVEQFTRLRDGDRYFYTGDPELIDNPAIDAVIDLDSITLGEIIALNTSIPRVPKNVFRVGRRGFPPFFANWYQTPSDWGTWLDQLAGEFGKGWGRDHLNFPFFDQRGGSSLGPFIVQVPEPSTFLQIVLAACLGSPFMWNRRAGFMRDFRHVSILASSNRSSG